MTARVASPLRLATRGSPLARRQADLVADALRIAVPERTVEVVVVRTEGDRRTEVPLSAIGGRGVFAKEVQAAVLDGRADVAVHSAKDLPPVAAPGLALAGVPERADPRDALVGAAWRTLRPGAVVATGSVRRRAQLAHLRPDLTFVELRGNMATRVAKAGQGGVAAVAVALAAMDRLGWTDRVAEVLSPTLLLPQVGQGAVALECRSEDAATRGVLAKVDSPAAHRCLDAERAFLAALGGSCVLPVGALAEPAHGSAGDAAEPVHGSAGDAAEPVHGSAGDAAEPASTRSGAPGSLRLRALLASGDGRVVVRTEMTGDDPALLGRAAAERLLTECGGAGLDQFAGTARR